jgi:hypothetical protein
MPPRRDAQRSLLASDAHFTPCAIGVSHDTKDASLARTLYVFC